MFAVVISALVSLALTGFGIAVVARTWRAHAPAIRAALAFREPVVDFRPHWSPVPVRSRA
jgi:hypothetical protein